MSFRMLRLLLLIICFFSPSSGTLQAVRFSKTVGSVASVTAACHLPEFTPFGSRISVKQACVIQCMKTTDCRFFCINMAGLACDLFTSYVAKRFPGHPSGTHYSACYTSWGDAKDVIKTDTLMTYSSNVSPKSHDPTFATDGYATCGSCEYFVTKHVVKSHAQFDLGSRMRINSVIVQLPAPNKMFNNIAIYLGNTTTFENHPVYGSQPGAAPQLSTNIISGDTSIIGRYLTIYSPGDVYLGICEVQVIKF